jgi:adenylate cyclase
LVTALFCDLVGFTPLSERLDPEQLRDVQREYFSAMREQIERYGGTVEKYAGDAVLALFGAPMAHEDDAERAVLCALGMQAAIEPVVGKARKRSEVEPGIRVGINTGEVVSGVWETSGRQDVAVTGDAVNTAARIQAAAEPGEVLVGAETMRLTRRRIRYGDLRELTLKGKVGPIPAYTALGLREQFGERWETSEQATPLVGRDRDLLELVDAWIRAQAGEGQLVTLVGDAGVGKSRLITELLERVGTSVTLRVLRARCLSYGQEISLWLVADLLRALFGIREQDSLEEIPVKLGAGIVGLLKERDRETQAEAVDVLGEVLGLPAGKSIVAHAGAQIRRQALIRDLRLVLRALSERSPAVLVLEDLHWIDEASARVLTEVLSDVPGLRLLVLAAHRPGWTAPWTDWGWTERMALHPLREEEATLLAGAVLGGSVLSLELERYVADRAGGNPFFVEEMLRALQETGGLEQRDGQMYVVPGAVERVPSTLTEVLLARLDRLESEARSVAQVASVIGRSLAVRLLAQVAGREEAQLEVPLMTLQRAEIAFPRRGSDLEYVFKHVSMRDVAYNTLVQKRRQELHLATARAITRLYPAEEYVEMIAYHYARTGEQGEAAEWLEKAGDRAASIYANETAIDNYREARRRLEELGAEPIALARLDEKLGDTLATVARYDDALGPLVQAAEIYRQAQDLEGVARVTARIGWTHNYRGTPQEGVAAIEPVLEMVTWAGPSQGLASLHLALAYLHFGSGRYRESLEAAERAGEMARAVGDERILGGAEMRRGAALTILGRTEEALRVLEGSVTLLEAAGDLETLAMAFNNLRSNYEFGGDLELAMELLSRALATNERVGNTAGLGIATMGQGQLHLYLGEWGKAEEHIERGAAVLNDVGASWSAASVPLTRGHLRLRQGRWEEAAHYLEETIALAHPIGDTQALHYSHWLLGELEVMDGRAETARDRLQPLVTEDSMFVGPLLMTLAWACLMTGDLELAEEAASRAVTLAKERQQRLWLPDVFRVQGMILTRQKHWEEAAGILEEAVSLARSISYPYAEARALYEFGGMFGQKGEPGRARERLEEALGIFRRLGATKDVERTERALATLDRSADPAR